MTDVVANCVSDTGFGEALSGGSSCFGDLGGRVSTKVADRFSRNFFSGACTASDSCKLYL